MKSRKFFDIKTRFVVFGTGEEEYEGRTLQVRIGELIVEFSLLKEKKQAKLVNEEDVENG